MIVLDATIVNVALPSIQDDLGFSQNDLAWVVNAYLIAFGGLLLLSGRIGDLVGQRRIFLIGLGVFTCASLALRPGAEPGPLDRCAVRPGRRWSADVRGDPGDDRDDVPGAPGAGEGDRHLHLRRSRRRLDRAPARRDSHRDDQLALDLLRQPPDRHCHGAVRGQARTRSGGHRAQRRGGHPRRRAAHRRPDARRLHDPRRRRGGLGIEPDADPGGERRSHCWPRSSSGRRGWRTRSCRCACFARATSPGRTWSRR